MSSASTPTPRGGRGRWCGGCWGGNGKRSKAATRTSRFVRTRKKGAEAPERPPRPLTAGHAVRCGGAWESRLREPGSSSFSAFSGRSCAPCFRHGAAETRRSAVSRRRAIARTSSAAPPASARWRRTVSAAPRQRAQLLNDLVERERVAGGVAQRRRVAAAERRLQHRRRLNRDARRLDARGRHQRLLVDPRALRTGDFRDEARELVAERPIFSLVIDECVDWRLLRDLPSTM